MSDTTTTTDTDTASERADRYEDVDTSHLDNVEDGCGCTEIWEHTSDRDENEDEE